EAGVAGTPDPLFCRRNYEADAGIHFVISVANFAIIGAGCTAVPRDIRHKPTASAPAITIYCTDSALGVCTPTITLTKPARRTIVSAPIIPITANARLCLVVCGGPHNV